MAVAFITGVLAALHQAVGFVEEQDFKRFGAYAITSKAAARERANKFF